MDKFNIVIDNSWAWVKTEVNENRHKSKTLLTLGDSFTWGDELGNSNGLHSDPRNDSEYREPRVYGCLLADMLDANWVQHALPGAGNQWILQEADKLVKQLYPITEQLILVITLTEMGRDVDSIAAEDEVEQIYMSNFKQGAGIYEVLPKVEEYYWNRLAKLEEQYPGLKIFCNYGFTFHITESKYLTKKNWTDVIMEYAGITNYPRAPLFKTGTYRINEFLTKHKLLSQKHKMEIGNSYGISDQDIMSVMNQTGIYLKRYHPNELGHKLWAEYLYNEIKDQL